MNTHVNADPAELAKFSDLAHRWWDPESEFKPLHEINPLRLDFIHQLADLRGKQVLDVGCGTGIYTKILKRRGADISGIDISKSMIEVAKREVSGVDFKVGSAYELPYRAGSFDLVLAALVIEHLTDLDKAFSEINRVLKKGGKRISLL